MKGVINKKPKKNLKKPIVKTLLSDCASFKKTLINTAQNDAIKAKIIALTLFVIR